MITVDTKELEEVIKELGRFKEAIPQRTYQSALNQAARPILQAAKRLVPVDTNDRTNSVRQGGATRRDLRIRAVKGEGDEIARVVIGVSKKRGKVGWRTHFIEYGTKYITPRPFLQQAFDSEIGKIGDSYLRLILQKYKGFK